LVHGAIRIAEIQSAADVRLARLAGEHQIDVRIEESAVNPMRVELPLPALLGGALTPHTKVCE
jgi:hypothetical protein